MNENVTYQELYWVRPDLTVMYPGDSETFKTLDGNAGWEVTDDWQMRIFVVQVSSEAFGVQCLRRNAQNIEVKVYL